MRVVSKNQEGLMLMLCSRTYAAMTLQQITKLPWVQVLHMIQPLPRTVSLVM